MPNNDREIPRDQWVPFFASFSSRHEGWLVSVDILDAAGGNEIVHDAALAGISVDGDGVAITALGREGAHLTHILEHPDSVVLELEPGGAEKSVTIRAGTTATRVQFRSTLLPEMVDGMP